MPAIVARRRSKCVVCALWIELDERISYTLEGGAKHMACSDQVGEYRRNEHRTECALCGAVLLPGRGKLEVVEQKRADGTFERKWIASCVSFDSCDARIRGET